MQSADLIKRLDAVVDDFVGRTKVFYEEVTPARAKMFVRQHRLNSRFRNSVLKLRVATNCPDWDLKIRIIGACAEEIIADHEHGGGKAHWEIMEELGQALGMSLDEIRAAEPTANTRLCWLAWEALMSNRHWLEGLVGNTCAERMNLPGYGRGEIREKGWSTVQRANWARNLGLNDDQLVFFRMHSEADVAHSNLGWHAVAQHGTRLNMEDAVIEACRQNLIVWERYFTGIAEDADRLG